LLEKAGRATKGDGMTRSTSRIDSICVKSATSAISFLDNKSPKFLRKDWHLWHQWHWRGILYIDLCPSCQRKGIFVLLERCIANYQNIFPKADDIYSLPPDTFRDILAPLENQNQRKVSGRKQ